MNIGHWIFVIVGAAIILPILLLALVETWSALFMGIEDFRRRREMRAWERRWKEKR